MRVWPKTLVFLLTWSWASVSGAAASEAMDAAIEAIQQAPDPSAAVTAYANGFALDRNNSKLYDAYVSRMVGLGLPEMAYHQAQTLTTLQANNGLAWGVVAYVDARRGQMPEAISAINLAGQFAPDNEFIQHTAGELVAWYDLKADKATIPANAKDGLAKVRALLNKRPAFTEAYATAQKAYQAQTTSSSQPGQGAPTQPAPVPGATNQAAPAPMVPNAPQAPPAPQAQGDQVAPLGYTTPAYYQDYSVSDYYPDYSGVYLDWGPGYWYGWGPGWVASYPWWWWEPRGFWSGCSFFPYVGVSFVFGDFDHYRYGGYYGHGGYIGRRYGPAYWHHGARSGNSFFGSPARPSASTAQWVRAGSAARWSSAGTAAGVGARRGDAGHGGAFTTASHGAWAGRNLYSRSYGTARSSWVAPSSRAPIYAGPRPATPSRGFSGGFGGRHGSAAGSVAPRSFSSGSRGGGFSGSGSRGGGFSGGGFHGGGFSGGGFHGGGFSGGGFHGGGFSGGGFHGGGHR